MIFVKQNNLASAQLRADQIAQKLNAPVYLNDLPEKIDGETIVFVKGADPDLVVRASTKGCKIIYDPIDTFSYPERIGWRHWYSFVDTAIAYNEKAARYLKQWFKDSKVIPHQWDARIEDIAKQDEFRPAYIGYGFNCPPVVPYYGVTCVNDPKDMLRALPEYNCHVSLRDTDSLQSKMKPATKVANAAAVGAVCITSPDASVIELLPKEYPYWCSTLSSFPKVLERAKDDFNGPVWNMALEMMDDVKDKTSLEQIAKEYKCLF